jgi:hypothetical protein
MDILWYYRYRHAGGKSRLVDWETSAGLDGWQNAPAPAKFGRLLIQRALHADLPASSARAVNNLVHWSTGIGWGVVFGVVESARGRHTLWCGLPFGAAVWLQSYAVLAPAKLYKPIWDYDAKTLANDLSAHLLYGVTTAAALNRLGRRRTVRRSRVTTRLDTARNDSTADLKVFTSRTQLERLES